MEIDELTEVCRCGRSCYQCPACTAQLAVTQVQDLGDEKGKDREELLKPPTSSGGGDSETYILQCHYCDWSSLGIGVQFNKSTKITEQLSRIRKTRTSTSSEQEKITTSHDETFTNLSNFYKEQLGQSTDPQNPYSNSPYSSPANLARIMSLYGGLPYNALKKSREKPQPMREALNSSEGLTTFSPSGPSTDDEMIRKMQTLGWEATTTLTQRISTPTNTSTRFTSDLWPAAQPLLTRRGRRCRTCRQFLTRPEQKVGSRKYKIRLLAQNYIPRLSLKPLHTQTQAAQGANPILQILRGENVEEELLQPYQTKHFLLTLRNPLFESVRISLATPGTTPGKIASRVTILCPHFTVGPAGELWDDALASSTSTSASGGRSAAMASLTGSSEEATAKAGTESREREKVPEAGKVWEKGRNWTSVVVEVVAGGRPVSIVASGGGENGLDEDEDVLKVPVYVRAEWEVDVKPEKGVESSNGGGGERVTKELGYWVVVDVGRIGG